MKTNQPPSPGSLNRRGFVAGVTVGLTSGLLRPSASFGAESSPGAVKRLLYVTNDAQERVDLFDIAKGHQLVRSFPIVGKKVGGFCADAATGRLFITQQGEDTVTAYDLAGTVLWTVNTVATFGLDHPDRLCITTDGSALYVPMKGSDVTLVLDPSSGERIAQFPRPGRPHNSWSGEQGRYMYVAGRSHHILYLADPNTHKVVKEIGPFIWPVRPFSVDREERFVYANLTYLPGFGVGDIETGKVTEVHHMPPYERTRHWEAVKANLPHGDHPFSHGIAVRPGAREVWYIDDQWGYLNVFDTSKSGFEPTFKGQVELFDEIDQPWGKDHGNRWVAFSLDGKYCYPSDGSVIDAESGKKTSMRISPSEKLIEVEFRGDTAVRVSGQMGGVYGEAV